MHTENEAKKKRCPQLQVAYAANGGMSDVTDNDFYTCIGSQCMAWRWWMGNKWQGDNIKRNNPEDEEKLGYCGLSGRPE